MNFMRMAKTWTEAARLSLEVGIDTELAWERPWDTGCAYGAPLVEGVSSGAIPAELLDKAVKNVLRAKFKIGLFDDGSEVVAWPGVLRRISEFRRYLHWNRKVN